MELELRALAKLLVTQREVNILETLYWFSSEEANLVI